MTCKTHPDAPHGFVRGASHSEDRYVCECEFWEEPKMNPLIKELAEQAGLTFVNSITDDNEDIECVADTDGGLPCSTELEKFAELIVQECAKIADIADESKCEWIGGNILIHFGV